MSSAYWLCKHWCRFIHLMVDYIAPGLRPDSGQKSSDADRFLLGRTTFSGWWYWISTLGFTMFTIWTPRATKSEVISCCFDYSSEGNWGKFQIPFPTNSGSITWLFCKSTYIKFQINTFTNLVSSILFWRPSLHIEPFDNSK